jgi:hypothetical protein
VIQQQHKSCHTTEKLKAGDWIEVRRLLRGESARRLVLVKAELKASRPTVVEARFYGLFGPQQWINLAIKKRPELVCALQTIECKIHELRHKPDFKRRRDFQHDVFDI